MESLRELYRIGPGPSSSHSLGVRNGCEYFYHKYPDHERYLVELYGSLSLTGKGHMSDKVIYDYFGKDKVEVVFKKEMIEHPNTMICYTVDDGIRNNETHIYSVGGGKIEVKGEENLTDEHVYPHDHLSDIMDYCEANCLTLAEYVFKHDEGIREHLEVVLNQMLKVVEDGLKQNGYLPGELHLKKVAREIYKQSLVVTDPTVKQKLEITAYAYAAMEESSSGNTAVTAPTLGSSGVISSLVYYYHKKGVSREKLLEALAVAGIIGNIVKTNASISGATGGCQAEIGTACAMGSGLACQVEGLSNHQIEYAAEVGMEHNLGLTCDPVGGYVQIPCIERNGVAALRCIDAMNYAKYISIVKSNRVSFDMIVKVMNYTGKKIPVELRETSLGGLAIELGNDEKGHK
ncbi:MAG: L-serine ammonia-lyase, iron-sulfur-dependent, subunit alpha [Erysipelotrichaceae bacterium]|nr:L-serine ammonia-lyase, iron-sulfur-dependent, subunit alpha [Erysipelotrichaceae bacterium]